MDTNKNVRTDVRGTLANKVVVSKSSLMGVAVMKSSLPSEGQLIKGRLQENLTVFGIITSSMVAMLLSVFVGYKITAPANS